MCADVVWENLSIRFTIPLVLQQIHQSYPRQILILLELYQCIKYISMFIVQNFCIEYLWCCNIFCLLSFLLDSGHFEGPAMRLVSNWSRNLPDAKRDPITVWDDVVLFRYVQLAGSRFVSQTTVILYSVMIFFWFKLEYLFNSILISILFYLCLKWMLHQILI